MPRWRSLFFLASLFALPGSPALALGDVSLIQDWQHRALEQRLDQDPYWRTLLHYRRRWLGGWKSEVSAAGFFGAPDGRTDPRAELLADIRRFFDGSAAGGQPVRCLFGDRYRWIASRLGADPRGLPEPRCTEYEEWKAALDPESVTLVFSAYFLNNPSSAFGHTLLRLDHRKRPGELHREPLLDYGVNYAATRTTNNPLAYGIMGLTGGFDGNFSNQPYFVKVAEYNDGESRDLWEYHLNLSAGQIERLMLHLWALGHFPVPYYFFDRNCSYMVLTLLDAANAELRLTDRFQTPWVIPANTVRAIARQPGLVRSVEVRPSLAYRIRRQRAGLSGDESALLLALVGAPLPEDRKGALARVRALPSARASRLVDTALDYLRYLKAASKGKLEPARASLQSELLGLRSELPDPAEPVTVSEAEIAQRRPDSGHDTARIGLGGGYNNQSRAFTQLGVRPAFQDLNAASAGYPEGAEIDALSFDLRYSPELARVRLDKANLIEIQSLAPYDPLFSRFSWAARLGADTVRDFDCNECLEYRASIGAGYSAQLARPLLAYLLAKAELGFGAQYAVVGGEPYSGSYRIGPAGELGARLGLGDRLSFLASVSYHHPVLGYLPAWWQGTGELRVSTGAQTDLRLGYDQYPATGQGRVIFNVYY